ncbi:DNA integration/recombination/inversion protein [Streptococcus pyogenes]|nr:DNA integration/recombination/inversion protein [Streptococcus pyogenes]
MKVHTTLEKDENGNWYRKDQTKTLAGERLIELDDVTIVVLENWRRNQVVNTDTDFIISRFGEPFCKSTICRVIKHKAQEVGVPVITGKVLRHSHASYLINVLKKDILYVVKCMGHADKSTTLNTYSHWFNALDKTVSEEITQNVISSGLDSILYQNSCQTTN